MKNSLILLYLSITSLLFATHFDKSEEKLKTLILVTASDDQLVYLEHQKIWRSYMHSDPEHFEAYFIKADPDLDVPYKIIDDVIWTKAIKHCIPGILDKTILSIECMLPRIGEFAYVMRPNLSSFYVFPRLLQFLNTLPRKECYCGSTWDNYVSGCGIILSSDLAELLVKQQSQINTSAGYDDSLLGWFYRSNGIGLIPASRTDIQSLEMWSQVKETLPPNAFHFRLKHEQFNWEVRLRDETELHKELVEMFYVKKKFE